MSSEALQKCVKKKMHKMSDEEGTQKQKLGKAFGICRDKLGIKQRSDFEFSKPFDTSKTGRWVTMRGTPVYIVWNEYKNWIIEKNKKKIDVLDTERSEILARYRSQSTTQRPEGIQQRLKEIEKRINELEIEQFKWEVMTEEKFKLLFPQEKEQKKHRLEQKQFQQKEDIPFEGPTFTSLGLKRKTDFDIIHNFLEDISRMPGSKHQKQGPSKPAGTGKVKVKKSTRKVAGKTVAVEAHERTVKRAKPEVKAPQTRKQKIEELKTSLAQTAEKLGGVKKEAQALESELIAQLPKSELKKREKAQEQKFKQLGKELETIQSKNQKQAQLHLLSQEVVQFGTTRTIITAMAPFVKILVRMMQGKEPTGNDIANAVKRVKTNTKIDRAKKEAIIKKMEAISGQLDKLKFNDFLVYDSFDSLVEWVLKNISDAKTESEAREIAFAIINSKKKSKKKKEPSEVEKIKKIENRNREIVKRMKQRGLTTRKERKKVREQILREEQNEGWKKTWEKIGKTFITQRAARARLRTQRKGAKIQFKRSLYGKTDFQIIHDFLVEDAARMAGSKLQREGPTKPSRTPPIRGKASSLFEQLQALIPNFFSVGGPAEVIQQVVMTNTETGQKVIAEIVEELDKNIIQMTPVSSSNVRAVGQFGKEALIQFHPGGVADPQKTYRFMTDSPEMAKEITTSLLQTGSPGRWVWSNIRGHRAGEVVTPEKIGPSLERGIPTIGGTSASLLPYKISARTPVKRIKGFENLVSKLKRMTSNPVSDPSTGSRVEGLLAGREAGRLAGGIQSIKGLPTI